MKLNYIIIYVDDAVKATEFYEKAFGIKTQNSSRSDQDIGSILVA